MSMAAAPPPKVAKFDGDSNEKESDKAAADEEQIILEKVVGIQHEIDQLNERASEEILHVEQKYNKLRQPHYKRRSSMLLNNSQFAELLSGEDETALQYLSNLVVEEYEDPNSGYRISFYFRQNPYFENEIISKELVMDASGDTTVTNTPILWKEGKDLTIRSTFPLDESSRKRGLDEQASFFSWFSADNTLEEPGEIIRDDIWPNPLQYYLNSEATLNETYDDEEDEEEEEDGLDDEEEEDDPDVIDLSDDDEDDV